MKSIILRFFSFTLALIFLCFAFVSCKPEKQTPVATVSLFNKDVPELTYTFVRPQKASDELCNATVLLRSSIKDAYGIALTVADDFYKSESEIGSYEILIGHCNRPECDKIFATLKYDDYYIGVVNEKLLILGGSDAATIAAVNYFVANLLNETLTYEQKELYRFEHSYPFATCQLENTDIGQFCILYGTAQDKLPALHLQEVIISLCGKALSVLSANGRTAEHEILVGECGRSGEKKSSSFDTSSDYEIKFSNGTLFLAGADALSKFYAAEKVGTDLLSGTSGGIATLAKTSLSGKKSEESCIRLVTNNIHSFDDFAPCAVKLVETYLALDPDVICLQECYNWKAADNSTGYQNVVDELSGTYACVVESRSFNTPILYKKSKFTLVNSLTMAYTDKAVTKTTSSKNKSFVIAILKEKATGKQFAVTSSHFALFMAKYGEENTAYAKYTDAKQGAEWRNLNAEQLLTVLSKFLKPYGDIPLLIAGDFNGSKNEAFYKTLTETLSDASSSAKAFTAGSYQKTFHAIGSAPSLGNPIDFIFSNDLVEILTFNTCTTTAALDGTDHVPLVVEFRIK